MAVHSINYLTLAQLIHSQPRKKAIMELTAFCKMSQKNPRQVSVRGKSGEGTSARHCMRDRGHRKRADSLMCGCIAILLPTSQRVDGRPAVLFAVLEKQSILGASEVT